MSYRCDRVRGSTVACHTAVKEDTVWKLSKYRAFSRPYFPAFRLNTERYFVSLRIQSECGKIRTRKNYVFGHFSRSENINGKYLEVLIKIGLPNVAMGKSPENGAAEEINCQLKSRKSRNFSRNALIAGIF